MDKSDYIGAGWAKVAKNGNKYLSLAIFKASFAVFKNKPPKKNPNSPDYSVIASNDLGKEVARFAELRKDGLLPPLQDIINKVSSDYGTEAEPPVPEDDDLPF